ncbi:MAG TPA: sigma-70 family RNA polymerase sigma factor [Candidatus Hydrogenedentes bacterium]|nr:sigma-70 family RNA polymerase sigma factor [Candidatus Hydrogenedentota bacterium]
MNEQSNVRVNWVRGAIDQYEAPLIRYAQRITGDLETARDAVQDTFLKLCAADREQVDAYLGPWLYRVCRNRALDLIKKEHRMHPLDTGHAEAQPSPAPDPYGVAVHREEEEAVIAAIDRLPEPQQEIFRLKFLDQLTYQEISSVTGNSVSQVRYLIHISLKAVRTHLQTLNTTPGTAEA